ncbi:glycosyltransferase family 4 protein [Dyadobacter sp. CY312]|uniref:glycosyltransferase family 4 protein n=1 Tax=Dyadobacter sp. CY312 TaxID=2907303 RepID=UPI001F3E2C17|nr:glycosyltransferase family 4 protein [Dyadobacter sp. CY312]MCE7041279.1 glycosyltransferase family 4 protein [Dyadobacter sp. CY312]
MKNKRWLTLFLDTENIHLTKDVGMIPFILFREFRYDSTIASYQNGEYPNIVTDVKGLKQLFVKKLTGNLTIDGLLFILINYNKFDILQVYHFTTRSLIWCYFFKIVKLGNCKTYLKLDANPTILDMKFGFVKSIIIEHLKNSIDLISVETKYLHQSLNKNWNRRVEYIPNGFYDYGNRKNLDLSAKENTILFVGRVGNYLKNNEILLEAFAEFAETKKDWKLMMVGPIESDFQHYFDNYFIKYPQLRNRIFLTGSIIDRQELRAIYNKSKIFVLTSRSESFGLVYLEAMQSGCYVISSNVPPAYDVTDNETYGSIFPIGSSTGLLEKLITITSAPELIDFNAIKVQNYVYSKFYWPAICAQIDHHLNP